MTKSLESRPRARGWRRNPLLALLLVLGLLAGVAGVNAVTAGGATITPSGPGAIGADVLVRDDSVEIKVNPGGYVFTRTSATPGTGSQANRHKYARFASLQSSIPCRGDNVATNQDFTPKSTVTILGPSGFSTVTQTSPVLDTSFNTNSLQPAGDAPNGEFSSYPAYDPQPAPNSTNYRGEVAPRPASNVSLFGVPLGTVSQIDPPGRGWAFQQPLSIAGVYTVVTETRNMVRTGSGACTIGTPQVEAASPTGFSDLLLPVSGPTGDTRREVLADGIIRETQYFEFRPWQQTFKDVLGNGGVNFNTSPAESQFNLVTPTGTKFSSIKPGEMSFFGLPSTESFMLPEDPEACVADPAGCLPDLANLCDPGAGCEPRLVLIDRHGGGESLTGVFDLDTRAFIAAAKVGGSYRILFSLGTVLDAIYKDTLEELATQADEAGIDLPTILSTQVVVRAFDNEYRLSLLNGLQIDPTDLPGGIEIISDFKVQAGIIIHTYAQMTSADCVARSADSADGATSFRRSVPVGYNVAGTPLSIPALEVPGVPVGVGGQVFLIQGNMTGVGTNTAILAGIGVDVDHGAPTKLPFWVLPTDGLLRIHSPRHFDYIGTASWSAAETPGEDGGCLASGGLTGIGVMINNPLLRLPLAELLAGVDNPAVNALLAQITDAVVEAAGPVMENATIADLLEQLTGAALGTL